jgi:hypothetical protein
VVELESDLEDLELCRQLARMVTALRTLPNGHPERRLAIFKEAT